MKETSYNKKGTSNTSMLGVTKIILVHLIQMFELGVFFYIKTISIITSSKKITINNPRIVKSFLLILPPPHLHKMKVTPNLSDIPVYNYTISNKSKSIKTVKNIT